jgi:dipeptidase E
MRYYLSSFKLGAGAPLLPSLYEVGRPVAYISNALDHVSDKAWLDGWIASDMSDLKAVGLQVERFDLREFFGAGNDIERALADYSGVWLSGGNVFVLRQAMRLSGLDDLICDGRVHVDFTYGGYSAACCVLSPTLEPFARVDDPTAPPYAEAKETIWDGLGVLDFAFMPHFRSNHSESTLIEAEVAFCVERDLAYRTFRDGEVLIIERGEERLVAAAA